MENNNRSHASLHVVGGIATGKTTFVEAIGELTNRQAIFEDYSANPFLAEFYEDPGEWAFETELTFLLLHCASLRRSERLYDRVAVDFSPIQDLAYADVNLFGQRYSAFMSVAEELFDIERDVSVVAHLRCSVDEQLRRIMARGRKFEEDMTAEYLRKINAAIDNRLKDVSGIVVLHVDSEVLDFRFPTTDMVKFVRDHLDGAVLNADVSISGKQNVEGGSG